MRALLFAHIYRQGNACAYGRQAVANELMITSPGKQLSLRMRRTCAEMRPAPKVASADAPTALALPWNTATVRNLRAAESRVQRGGDGESVQTRIYGRKSISA